MTNNVIQSPLKQAGSVRENFKVSRDRNDRTGVLGPLLMKGAKSRKMIRRNVMNSGIQATPQRDVLTLREVASILRCSKTHVSNAVNGKVPGLPRLTHVAIGRRILIRKEWLDEWMEANKRKC